MIALCSAGVSAMPITEWEASVQVAFSDAAFAGNQSLANFSPDELRWFESVADGGESSALVITPGAGGHPLETPLLRTIGLEGVELGQPNTIGESVTITHENSPLQGDSASLTDATVSVSLVLTPLAPPGVVLSSVETQIEVDFDETTNDGGDDGLCEDLRAPPEPGGCEDVFVVSPGSFNRELVLDDITYFLNFFPVEFGVFRVLEPGECTGAGAPVGCVGFITLEETSNPVEFGYTISSEALEIPPRLPPPTDVAAPATLSLLPFMAILFGASRRSR